MRHVLIRAHPQCCVDLGIGESAVHEKIPLSQECYAVRGVEIRTFVLLAPNQHTLRLPSRGVEELVKKEARLVSIRKSA